MKKISVRLLIILLFVISGNMVYSQQADNTSIGGFVGTSYYNGDFNPDVPFTNLGRAIGIIYRHHFNQRHILKYNFTYSVLNGKVSDHFVPNPPPGGSFKKSAYDMAVQFEFNFFRYNELSTGKYDFTPYLSSGIFVSAMFESFNPKNFILGIPVAIGINYNIKNRLTIGIEYGYRLSFSDEIDNTLNGYDIFGNPPKNNSIFHNNDIYAFAGLFVTWRLYNRGIACPAYK